MDSGKTLEFKDPREFALRSFLFLVSFARQVGELDKPYVINALNTIRAFSHNPAVINKAVNDIRLRLERKRALQLLHGNVFSLPSPGILKGDIYLGNTAEDNKETFLSLRNINENIGIWGRAGGGKTNLCQLLVLQSVQADIPVRTYDYKAEYRDLLPHIQNMLVLNPKYDKFNPLEPIGNPKEWLQFLADTMQQDFNLKPETKFMWLNYADELYKRYDIYDKGRVYPSMHNMKEFLIEEADKKSTSASRKRKIYTCLEVLNSLLTSIGGMLDCSSGYTEEALSDFSFVSYEMSNLSSNIQSWLSKLRLKHLYHRYFSGKERNRLKMVGIFEEAKMLFSESLHQSNTSVDYIKQLFTQGRSSGFGLIVTDQNKNELADFVLNNLSCQICFNLASPKEMRATGYSLGCNEEQVEQLRYLRIPQAVVSLAGHSPFMIRIPKSPVERHISDDELMELVQPKLSNLKFSSKEKPQIPIIRLSQNFKQVAPQKSLGDFLCELKTFLIQVKNSPELNISQLYSCLNLSGRKGNKLKGQLLTNSLIQEETTYTGKRKRPSKHLKVTEKGNKVIQWLEKKARVD